jgi:hypothetical protein
LLALAATVFRPPPAHGPFARDFEAYYAAGATWNRGGDPWSRAIWPTEATIPGVDRTRDELLPFVGPAAELPLLGAFARLPYALEVGLWTSLLVVALLFVVAAAFALGSGRGVRLAAAALLLAAAAGPAISALALGQAALISAAGIALALLALERGSVIGAAVASLAAAVQPNLALVLLARLRDRRAFVAFVTACVAFAALTFAAGGGTHGFGNYLRVLSDHGRAERFDLIQFTPAAIAWSLGAPAPAAAVIGIAVSLIAIVAVVATILRAQLGPRDGTLLALAALPFAVPFFHEHDFVVELIPLTILALVARAGGRAWVGVAAGLILVDWLMLAQRVPAQPEVVLAGLAAACAFVALGAGPRLRRSDLAAPLSVLLVAACALPLAHLHPAPVWPDTLPPSFHAPVAADAPAVWAAEQRAAGLLAQVPAWGALRAIPLAGCIVLGVALVRTQRRQQQAGDGPSTAW